MQRADKSMSGKSLSFIIKLAVTLLILYLVLSSIPGNEYRHALALLSWQPLLYILLLTIVQVIFLASRWNLLAKAAGSRLSFLTSIFGILMSFFFSQGLPASVGGDAFRIWWHRREGIKTSSALKIIFFDRLYGMLSLVLLCVGSTFLLTEFLGGEAKIITLVVLLGIIGGTLGLLIMPWRMGFSERLNLFSMHLPSKLKSILQWIVTMRISLSQQKLHTTSGLLVIGVIVHLLVVAQVFIIGNTLSPNKINAVMCFAVVPPALFISYMPFSIAGWGVREASMVVAFGLFGVQASTAILISLIIGMVILAVALLGGLLWVTCGFRTAYFTHLRDKKIMMLDVNY